MFENDILISNENKKNEFCVLCHKETNIPKNKNINERKNYIIGIGQLCDDCAIKLNFEF